jgi:O-antigen ligase
VTRSARQIWLWGSALAILAAAFAAGWFAQPALLLLPFALLAAITLLQQPAHLLYVLLACIPWSIEFSVTETLGTDLPDEPLMLLAAFGALCLLASFRFSKKQLAHPLLLVLLLQLVWTLFTVFVSTHAQVSIKYLLAKSWYLLAFVGLPLFLFSSRRTLTRAAAVLLGSMFLSTLYCLFRQGLLGWSFGKTNEALEPFYRNHVNYSSLLVCMLPLQWAFYRLCGRRARLGFLILLSITAAALLLSYARGAWLAALLAVCSYALLRRRWLLKAFVAFALTITLAACWLIRNDHYLRFAPEHNTTIFHPDFEEHLVATYQGKDMSTAERFYRWIAGARMVKDRWMTGYGPNTFYENYKPYAVPSFRTWVSDNSEHSTVHNYFLLMLIEQGVIGLLLFLLLVGLLFWYLQRVYRQTTDVFWQQVLHAVAAILVMICTIIFLSDMIETDKVGSIFYLCVATLVVADLSTRREEARGGREH